MRVSGVVFANRLDVAWMVGLFVIGGLCDYVLVCGWFDCLCRVSSRCCFVVRLMYWMVLHDGGFGFWLVVVGCFVGG